MNGAFHLKRLIILQKVVNGTLLSSHVCCAVLKLTFAPYSQQSITGFMETVKKAEEWTKEGLKEHIIHFIVETDQVNGLLLYTGY
jgi:hypothetical protein